MGRLCNLIASGRRGTATGEQGRGAGLGLAIARRLVVAQGGRLLVENRPDGGARFTVVLPLLRA